MTKYAKAIVAGVGALAVVAAAIPPDTAFWRTNCRTDLR